MILLYIITNAREDKFHFHPYFFAIVCFYAFVCYNASVIKIADLNSNNNIDSLAHENSFDVGTIILNSDGRYIYDVLSMQDELLSKYSLSIDDCLINSADNKNGNLLYLLAISSNFFAISVAFLSSNSQEDKKIRKELKQHLFEIKKMSANDQTDRENKLLALVEILKKYHTKYILIDFNQEINFLNDDVIKKVFSKIDFCPVFQLTPSKQDVLSFGQNGIEFNELDLSTEENNVSNSTKKIKKAEHSRKNKQLSNDKSSHFIFTADFKKINQSSFKEKFQIFLQMIKQNWLSLFLILFSTILITIFSSLMIYSFENQSTVYSVLIIVAVAVLFINSASIIVSCFDFLVLKQHVSRDQIVFVTICVEFSLLLAAILGYLCVYIFYLLNFFVVQEYFHFWSIYPSAIFLFLLIILPALSKPINSLISNISNKIKSKKKKNN